MGARPGAYNEAGFVWRYPDFRYFIGYSISLILLQCCAAGGSALLKKSLVTARDALAEATQGYIDACGEILFRMRRSAQGEAKLRSALSICMLRMLAALLSHSPASVRSSSLVCGSRVRHRYLHQRP